MRPSDWLQLAVFVAVLSLITKPMGLYLAQVLDVKGRTWLDPVLRPLERVTYRLMGVNVAAEQDWKQYTLAMLLFSLVSCLFYIRDFTTAAPVASQPTRVWPRSVLILRSTRRSVSRAIHFENEAGCIRNTLCVSIFANDGLC